ncbi:VRR-NUC domain-containing protein [Bacillaceae bacterium Marseille-Q3522]|nr:VRR-NUC domain-containing protein [Bacillaceae bacterium Marseille-Q3522]
MSESNIERRLAKKVEKLGGLAPKFLSGIAGVPDRLILAPGGRAFFVETKDIGEKLRPLQQKRKQQLERLGFKVYKIDSIDKIDGFIEEVFT